MLLGEKPERLQTVADLAEDRVMKHKLNEELRKKEKLPTDMERYLKGERIRD